jgi:prepilin-type N-terminal cleavage/methylation domain-containing protein
MSNRRDHGFTLIELLIVVTIIAVIAALAAPGLLRARMTSNESSAIASLKITTSAELAYAASCGSGAFASTYMTLSTPPAAGSVGFISADLGSAAPRKSGYSFTLGAGAGSGAGPIDCNGTGTITAYYAKAAPDSVGMTGTRSFAVNTAATIWQLFGGIAPAEPFVPPAAPIQ